MNEESLARVKQEFARMQQTREDIRLMIEANQRHYMHELIKRVLGPEGYAALSSGQLEQMIGSLLHYLNSEGEVQ